MIAGGIGVALGPGFMAATGGTTSEVGQAAVAAATAQTGDPVRVVSASAYGRAAAVIAARRPSAVTRPR